MKEGNSWDAAKSWHGSGTRSKNCAGVSVPIGVVRVLACAIVSLFHVQTLIVFAFCRGCALRALTYFRTRALFMYFELRR